jgi:hypothetical protein
MYHDLRRLASPTGSKIKGTQLPTQNGFAVMWLRAFAAFGIFVLTTLTTQSSASAQTDYLVGWPHIDRSSVSSTATGFFPGGRGRAPVRLTRIATVGTFAVVSFQHGTLEATDFSGQILLQRFPFGWQAIDVSRSLTTEDLEAHGVSASDASLLLNRSVPEKGMHARASPCAADVGTRADVAAVRQLLLYRQNEAILQVTIVSGFALAAWAGNGGGMDVLAERSGTWRDLAGGGGAVNAADLEKLEIPAATAKRLIQLNARCA